MHNFKEIEDTKVETIDEDNVLENEDSNDFKFDEEENNNTNDDWDARFNNDNK